jgi:hypothetical protein
MQKLVFSTVLAGCLTALASVGFAQDAGTQTPQGSVATVAATTPPADTPTAVAPDSDKVVTCKREAATGSYITKRVCHTASEWKQIEQSAHEMLEKRQGWSRDGSGG